MGDVAYNLKNVLDSIPDGVELVAVSKFHPEDKIIAAYSAGQRKFGESRVQELQRKIPNLPDDIHWHFIGHLQSNKVRQLLSLPIELIESVDSEKLLSIIDNEAFRLGRKINVLMQIHVAREDTKFGFYPEELIQYFLDRKYESLKATHICGLMGMASNTDDEARIRDDFRKIARVFDEIKKICGADLRGFDVLSMGMSDDRTIAVEEGSTMVRVGTAIFGERDY